jgi:hypothetical protein
MQNAQEVLISEFPSNMYNTKVNFYFGVDSLSNQDVNIWDPSLQGRVIFENSFDLSSKEAQQSLNDFCIELNSSSRVISMNCWILDFKNDISTNGSIFPIEKEYDFNLLLVEWARNTSTTDLGFINDKLKFFQIEVITNETKFVPDASLLN